MSFPRRGLFEMNEVPRFIGEESQPIIDEILLHFVHQNDSFGTFSDSIKVDKKPGQDMVYISSNERVLEIFCSGYEPMKVSQNISLRNWEIPPRRDPVGEGIEHK